MSTDGNSLAENVEREKRTELNWILAMSMDGNSRPRSDVGTTDDVSEMRSERRTTTYILKAWRLNRNVGGKDKKWLPIPGQTGRYIYAARNGSGANLKWCLLFVIWVDQSDGAQRELRADGLPADTFSSGRGASEFVERLYSRRVRFLVVIRR
jgi:hypothetical protein